MSHRPFVMVPLELLHSDVSSDALRLWCVVDDLARQDESAAVSQAALASAAGMGTARRLRRLVAELVAAGWLEVHRRGPRAAAYRPLRRARRPQPAGRPVDNLRERADTSVRSFTLKSGHQRPVFGAGLLLRAREEEEARASSLGVVDNHLAVAAGAGAARRPAWCGRCHEPTRMLDLADGRVGRCPACHPSSVPVF